MACKDGKEGIELVVDANERLSRDTEQPTVKPLTRKSKEILIAIEVCLSKQGVDSGVFVDIRVTSHDHYPVFRMISIRNIAQSEPYTKRWTKTLLGV